MRPHETSADESDRPPVAVPPPRRRGGPPGLSLWPPVLLVVVGGWVALTWWSGGYDGLPGSGAGAVLLLQGALLNAALLMGLLDLRERAGRRRARIAGQEETLRHLRTWIGEEGLARKVGLLRDLNAEGAVPADLEGIALPGADLSGIDLRGCRLWEADLRGARLRGARLDGADLWGADLSGADLSQAALPGASLRGCSLRDAMLTKADLAGASLHRADLVNANVEGVRLETVHLTRARFADGMSDEMPAAIHPSVEDWVRARLDARGYYAGENPPGAGPRPDVPHHNRVRR